MFSSTFRSLSQFFLRCSRCCASILLINIINRGYCTMNNQYISIYSFFNQYFYPPSGIIFPQIYQFVQKISSQAISSFLLSSKHLFDPLYTVISIYSNLYIPYHSSSHRSRILRYIYIRCCCLSARFLLCCWSCLKIRQIEWRRYTVGILYIQYAICYSKIKGE